MTRVIFAFVFVAWTASAVVAAEPRQFAEPLNVREEQFKIYKEFDTAKKMRVPLDQATAARDDAFIQLAAAAEQANSEEYRILREIYETLGRHEDIVRVSRKVLDKLPDDFRSRAALVNSLCALKRLDEVEAELRVATALEVRTFSVGEYLRFFPEAAKTAISYLIAAGKTTEASQALDAWVAQLDIVETEGKRLNGFFMKPGSWMSDARQSVDSLESELRSRGVEVPHYADRKLNPAAQDAAKDSEEQAKQLASIRDTKNRFPVVPPPNKEGSKTTPSALPSSEHSLQTSTGPALSPETLAKMRQSVEKGPLDVAAKRSSHFPLLDKTNPTRPSIPSSSGSPSQAEIKGLRSAVAGQNLLGKPLPPLTEMVWLNGAAPKPEDLKGKLVFVELFHLGDDHCKAVLQQLQSWQDQHGDQGLVIIGITWRSGLDWDPATKQLKPMPNLASDKVDAAIAAAANDYGLKFPIAVAPDKKLLLIQYGVIPIPFLVLVDRQGLVQQTVVGRTIKAIEPSVQQTLGLIK